VADQIDARATNVRRDAKWLNQRIGELQARVQEAENRAQLYRAQHGITDANGKSVGDQELADYASELGKARSRTIDAKTRFERFQQLAAAGKISELPTEAAKSGVLDKLRGQYADLTRQEANLRTTLGERHPAMIEVQNQLRDTRKSITDELKRMSEAAGAEYLVAKAAEAETAKRVEDSRRATNDRNKTSVELRELERDVDASRVVYEKFLRARETMDQDIGDGVAARVIAPALAPVAPSSPKATAILFASVASGLFAGIGIALFNDYMSHAGPSIRRRDDAIDLDAPDGKTPVLVVAPRIGPARRKISSIKDWMMRTRADEASAMPNASPMSEVEAHPNSEFSKAIGDLYAALASPETSLRRSRRRTRVILVASMEDGAGKTTIAANLARHAANLGQKTLLIDANQDNPSLGGVAPTNASAGLIELTGKSRPVYRATETLWVVPIMAAEERIVSRLLRRPNIESIDRITGEFDFVVIDGPTIELDGQARDMASAVDRVVIVAAEGEILPSMDDVADLLEVPESKVAGAVVSASAPSKAA
jgi:succinoglycan biosynthesis transport protein ExoP